MRTLLLAPFVLLAAATVLTASEPFGTYDGAKMDGKITDSVFRKQPLRYRDGRVKVKTNKIVADFFDPANDADVKFKMRLLETVEDVGNQVVTVDPNRSEFFVRDRRSGAIIGFGGVYNAATFRIKERDDGSWKVKQKKTLRVREIEGVLRELKGELRATKD